jgi:hypothetical protein
MQTTRLTSEDLVGNKQTKISDELRSDRQTSDMAEVGFETGGSLNLELSVGDTYDDLIEAALCGTFSNVLPGTATTLSMVATTRTVTDDDVSGAFANAVAGQWIAFSGFVTAANNGWHQIATVTSDNEITLVDNGEAFADETGSGDEVARGKRLTNGIVKRSYAIEKAFTDSTLYQLFLGMRVGSMNLSVQAGEIVTGSFGFMGTSMDAADGVPFSADGSAVAATTTPVVNATSNVGQILVDGSPATVYMQSFDLAIDNALRSKRAIGEKYPFDIGYGRSTITGSLSAYFEDLTLFDVMRLHSDVGLAFPLIDINNRGIRFEFPRVKFGSDNPVAGGIDQDVMEPIDWTAIVDDVSGSMVIVDIA